MRLASTLRLSTLTLILCTGLMAAAAAEDAATPPDRQQKPKPDAGTTAQLACIEETGDYEAKGKLITFVIGLENKCDKRFKCEVFAYVVGAKGPAKGHAILVLGPKSNGADAKKSYAMKVKMAGGTAQVSRECRVF